MKKLVTLIAVIVFLIHTQSAFAQSAYVLPYPSSMPGSIFYKINTIREKVARFWHFGDFSTFKYSLFYADKYLVEAKTLFEYKQYLLAVNALGKSDFYFKNIYSSLLDAKKNNKDISEKLEIYKSAADKHKEILEIILNNTPNTFSWNPEKGSRVDLNIKAAIENSIKQRNR